MSYALFKTFFKPKTFLFLFLLFSLGNISVSHAQPCDITTAQDINDCRKLAEEGDAKAQYNIGLMFFYGKKYISALKWLTKAAEQNNPDAQKQLGDIYGKGQGVKKDYEKANEYYEKAFKIYEDKAKNGDTESQYTLSQMYYDGQGTLKDFKKSFNWLETSAKKGNLEAEYSLGFKYHYGNGTIQNYEEAIKWYKICIEHAESSKKNLFLSYLALTHLSEIYGDALKDYKEAFKYYKKLADKEDSFFQTKVGVMYYLGQGVKKDDTEAVKWFRKAAQKGYSDAQGLLASAYSLGEGVPQSSKEAYIWYNISYSSYNNDNDVEYKNELKRLREMYSKGLSPQELADAQRISLERQKWIEKQEEERKKDPKRNLPELAWFYDVKE